MGALTKSIQLKHYKRREIQELIIAHAQRKEIGTKFDYGFGKRPDVLTYPREVLDLALKGMTSLHSSEELWMNPMSIESSMSRKQLDAIRDGWDLVLDIDCPDWDFSKLTAHLFIRALEDSGVKDIGCKFSGNKGFHVGVPFEAFPKEVAGTQTKQLFPEGPRKMAQYLLHLISTQYVEVKGDSIVFDGKYSFTIAEMKEKFGKGTFIERRCSSCDRKIIQQKEEGDEFICSKCDHRIISEKDFEQCEKCHSIMEKMQRRKSLCVCGSNSARSVFDPLSIIEVDTVLIASRHLYRMPYSLHEKSALVSVPINPTTVMQFDKVQAKPEAIQAPYLSFLPRENVEESARNLLLHALDFDAKIDDDEDYSKSDRVYEEITIESPITEEFFPPCMKTILKGMEDGKKRAVFILMNFLGKIGWNKEQIKEYLYAWNKQNPEPLREVYIKGQLAHFKPGAKLPPNCDNEGYYKALGLKCEGTWCSKIKNPVNYTISRWRFAQRDKKETKSTD